MLPQTFTKSEVISRLQECGINPTQQRVVIAQLLFSRPQHLSADQVLRNVVDGGANVSKATVYNTLALFAEKGLVREVIVDPTKVFYDSNTSLHHHFYNVDSGELMDIETDQLPISEMPQPPQGMVTEGVDVIIRVRNNA